ncbi:MAG: DUF362 domain-containing protein [Nitrospinota bacterium]
MNRHDRRDFLKKAAGATTAAAAFGVWGYLYHDPDNPVRKKTEKIYAINDFFIEKSNVLPEVVVVHGSDPAKNVRAAVERLGGISRFIRPGERVTVKPNAGWDRMPEQAANTNPLVIEEIARLCREAKAVSVVVTDVSTNDIHRSFTRSGILDAARNAGAKVIFPSESGFPPCDLKGEMLTVWPVFKQFIETDRLINAPVVKHHSLCKATLAMKNWYGTLGGRRNRLHQDIHTSIADLASAFKPTLTVMDASRILMRGGPTGGNLDDVKITNMIIAGTDEVAIDAFSATLLGYERDEIEYIRKGQQRGLGNHDLSSVRMEEINL